MRHLRVSMLKDSSDLDLAWQACWDGGSAKVDFRLCAYHEMIGLVGKIVGFLQPFLLKVSVFLCMPRAVFNDFANSIDVFQKKHYETNANLISYLI